MTNEGRKRNIREGYEEHERTATTVERKRRGCDEDGVETAEKKGMKMKTNDEWVNVSVSERQRVDRE